MATQMTMQTPDTSLIFCGEMVRAIGDGSKTQTRRIIVPQPDHANDADIIEHIRLLLAAQDRSPYKPGDLVRVRETWASRVEWFTGDNGVDRRHDIGTMIYRADNACHRYYQSGGWTEPITHTLQRRDSGVSFAPFSWTSAIHMPRWASRYWLEITSVRAERVQEITEDGAIAEGCQHCCNGADCGCRGTAAMGEFVGLWDSLYAKPKRVKKNPYTRQREDCYVSYPWKGTRETVTLRGLPHYKIGNPWVYMDEFKTVAAPTHSGQETP